MLFVKWIISKLAGQKLREPSPFDTYILKKIISHKKIKTLSVGLTKFGFIGENPIPVIIF